MEGIIDKKKIGRIEEEMERRVEKKVRGRIGI